MATRPADDEAWRTFRAALRAAQNRFAQGDSGGMRDLYSHGEDASIFGGFGGLERGWDEVGPRLDWAAGQFSGGKHDEDLLFEHVGDDFSYTVAIEHNHGGRHPQTGRDSSVDLRVTMIYRKEGGAWRIVHRQADPVLQTRPPG